MISGDNRTINHNVANMPASMKRPNVASVTIAYDQNRSRFKRFDTPASVGLPTTTHYVGSIEKIMNPNNVVKIKRYIDAETVVTVTVSASGVSRTQVYFLKDHLGSSHLLVN